MASAAVTLNSDFAENAVEFPPKFPSEICEAKRYKINVPIGGHKSRPRRKRRVMWCSQTTDLGANR